MLITMEWQKLNGTVLNYDNMLYLIIWDACYLELLLLLTLLVHPPDTFLC